jgi:hypothetical protein
VFALLGRTGNRITQARQFAPPVSAVSYWKHPSADMSFNTGTNDNAGAGMAAVPREAVLEELERIVASPRFSRSERLCRFLRFSVDSTLRGDTDRVKEFVVGAEVFGRGSSFDPRVDPVVRVEARRLRSRLKEWYEREGRNSRVIIELPAGSYSAVFRQRAEPS